MNNSMSVGSSQELATLKNAFAGFQGAWTRNAIPQVTSQIYHIAPGDNGAWQPSKCLVKSGHVTLKIRNPSQNMRSELVIYKCSVKDSLWDPFRSGTSEITWDALLNQYFSCSNQTESIAGTINDPLDPGNPMNPIGATAYVPQSPAGGGTFFTQDNPLSVAEVNSHESWFDVAEVANLGMIGFWKEGIKIISKEEVVMAPGSELTRMIHMKKNYWYDPNNYEKFFGPSVVSVPSGTYGQPALSYKHYMQGKPGIFVFFFFVHKGMLAMPTSEGGGPSDWPLQYIQGQLEWNVKKHYMIEALSEQAETRYLTQQQLAPQYADVTYNIAGSNAVTPARAVPDQGD